MRTRRSGPPSRRGDSRAGRPAAGGWSASPGSTSRARRRARPRRARRARAAPAPPGRSARSGRGGSSSRPAPRRRRQCASRSSTRRGRARSISARRSGLRSARSSGVRRDVRAQRGGARAPSARARSRARPGASSAAAISSSSASSPQRAAVSTDAWPRSTARDARPGARDASWRLVRAACRAAVTPPRPRARGWRRRSSRRSRPRGAGAARSRGRRSRSAVPTTSASGARPSQSSIARRPTGTTTAGSQQPHERVRPGPAVRALAAVGSAVAAPAGHSTRVALRHRGEREALEHAPRGSAMPSGASQVTSLRPAAPANGSPRTGSVMPGAWPDDQRPLPLARPQDRRRHHARAHPAPRDRLCSSASVRTRAAGWAAIRAYATRPVSTPERISADLVICRLCAARDPGRRDRRTAARRRARRRRGARGRHVDRRVRRRDRRRGPRLRGARPDSTSTTARSSSTRPGSSPCPG